MFGNGILDLEGDVPRVGERSSLVRLFSSKGAGDSFSRDITA